MSLPSLCQYLRILDTRGYTRATSGNYSLRQSPRTLAITRSGVQKGEVTTEDFILMELDGQVLASEIGGKPSDETELHLEIYLRDSLASCILHVHSVSGTALSMRIPYSSCFSFCGYEMQKAIYGCSSHEKRVEIPILENSQEIPLVVKALRERWNEAAGVKAFYLRGHGLYTWGDSLELARRSLEAVEFLFEVEMLRGWKIPT
jgi:methylthioribulose-1-phosphate dehydratase